MRRDLLCDFGHLDRPFLTPALRDRQRVAVVEAERIAITTYTEIIAWLGNGDPTTRRVIEQILATEEEHAEDMLSLLED